MRVKINGKEVEVGPSKHIKEKLDTPSIVNQTSNEKDFNYFKLKINGREVDMNNPDDVQRALNYCRMMGGISLGISIIALFMVENGIDWMNFDFNDDIFSGLFVISIWLILGTIFFIFTPKSLQKRLDELKKQGKVPSKH